MRKALVLVIALTACRVGEQLPVGAAPGTNPATASKTEQMVRVGIKIDTTLVNVSGTAGAVITNGKGDVVRRIGANEVWTFTPDQLQGGTLLFDIPDDAFVKIGDRQYRGDVLIREASPGKLTAINIVGMERYLMGVVPFEIGRNVGIEAMKAQAIAARTYAIGNMNGRAALGFDFYNTVADQVYGGTSGEDSLITRAVMETRGEILTHAGRPILAYYSSTCGGHTADVNESWPWRPPQPYLKGKPDTDENGEAYCKTSNRFRWNVSWRGDSLRAVLQQTLALRTKNPDFKINRVEDVKVTGNSKSGRAEAVAFTVDGTTYRVPADSIRWVLKPTTGAAGLNSSLIFDLKATQTNGEVSRLDVRGGGWGHGIGMCQVGAINRAKAGQNYKQILTAYYTDANIERLY